MAAKAKNSAGEHPRIFTRALHTIVDAVAPAEVAKAVAHKKPPRKPAKKKVAAKKRARRKPAKKKAKKGG